MKKLAQNRAKCFSPFIIGNFTVHNSAGALTFFLPNIEKHCLFDGFVCESRYSKKVIPKFVLVTLAMINDFNHNKLVLVSRVI